MCLAIPGKIIKKINSVEAEVMQGSIRKQIRIELLPEIDEGDYVLIHAGYAITKIDQKQADEIEQIWKEIES